MTGLRFALADSRDALTGTLTQVYQADDRKEPGWLAVAEIGDPHDLAAPAPGILDERGYELIDSHGHEPAEQAMLVSVGFDTSDEPGLHAWYLDEHIPLLHRIPGWWRTRRYRLVRGDAPVLMALHEISGRELFRTDGYKAATTTQRQDAVLRTVQRSEIRLFRAAG